MIACKHKAHRIPDHPYRGELILPECAGRQRWLEARRGGVGGSEISALVGANEYMTTFDVYRNKIEEVAEITGNEAIEWGHRLEEAVAVKVADDLGLVARPGGGIWRHPDHEFARVTPDRIATKPRRWDALGLIECKTAGEGDDWAEDATPLAYEAQMQWQLGILGFERGWLGCLVLGRERDFHIREIEFDPEWFAEMLNVAETFWVKHVLPEEPPMFDFEHPRTSELMKELHPRVVQPSIELPDEATEWIEKYHELKAEEKRIERELDGVKNWFRMQMEDAGAGYVGEHKAVSFPEVKRSGVDVEILQEEYPEAYLAAKKTTTHRRLTVLKSKALRVDSGSRAD